MVQYWSQHTQISALPEMKENKHIYTEFALIYKENPRYYQILGKKAA